MLGCYSAGVQAEARLGLLAWTARETLGVRRTALRRPPALASGEHAEREILREILRPDSGLCTFLDARRSPGPLCCRGMASSFIKTTVPA